MKHIPCKSQAPCKSCRALFTNQKLTLFILIMALAITPFFSNAQFIRSYQIQPQQSLTFNCISKSLTGTYFIAGIADTSVYVAEVDQSGNKLRERLIGVGNKAYNLTSMITDADGNIVIVGSIQLALTNTKAFLMKISPVLSLLLHKTYENLNQKGSAALFTQVNDYRTGSILDAYYISGATRNNSNNTASDVLLLAVNRNTGAITNTYSGNLGEDNYDAFVLRPGRAQTIDIYATGRLSTGGTSTFRPWINRHNSNLSFNTGQHYLQPVTNPSRLYSSSLIIENTFTRTPRLTYCWYGDLNAGGNSINIGMGSYDANLLNPPIWQREYIVTPAAARYRYLNQVVADVTGYIAEGNWWSGTTYTTDNAIAGEMFLLRTDRTGAPLWSRRINQVFVNQRSHNSGMLIDNVAGVDMIYAVGFRTGANGTTTEGVLVQIPTTGKMDTLYCAPKQDVIVSNRDYYLNDSINTLRLAMADSLHYYPIDCVTTRDSITCDTPCIPPVLKSADFQLTGIIPIGNTTTFQVTASLFNNTQNSQWTVSDITSGTPVNIESDPAGGGWSPASASTQFSGYYLSGSHYGLSPGQFLQLHKYRFQHIVSASDNCGIVYSDTVTKSIYMCTNCRTKGMFTVETEYTGSGASSKNSLGYRGENGLSKTIAYPNPANGSITFALSSLQAKNPVLQILDARGQVMKTVKVNSNSNISIGTAAWASGTYIYQVIASGNIINKGNFEVSH